MTRRRQRIGPLLGPLALLGAILAYEIMAGPFFVPDPPTASSGANAPVVSPNQPPPVRPDISGLSEIVARPLFVQTRRPLPPKAQGKVAENEPKAEMPDLIGVIISKDTRMVLLRTNSTSEVLRAVEGQNVGGWEVRAIKPTQVVLQRGDESEVIKINNVVPPASQSLSKTPSAPNTLAANNPSVASNPSTSPGGSETSPTPGTTTPTPPASVPWTE